MSKNIPVLMTIAGSDSCGGAGIQADLKVFAAHRVHGLSAVTCVVSEVPGIVRAIHPVPTAIIADQIRLLFDHYPVAAMKTGMLYDPEVIRLTAEILSSLPPSRRPFLVVDPVMVATSGDSLILPDAIAAYRDLLFPLATVMTPNLDEAAVLLGRPVTRQDELAPSARELFLRYGCPVLLKGGHLAGPEAVDVLHDGAGNLTLSAPFIPGRDTHGTGCTYSSAIAARLGQGENLRNACQHAKSYITFAIKESHQWENGPRKVQALCQWTETS